jgi:peptidoglycan/xylan/chitin deacetylase (PgdA/CDA1 family)
MYEYGTRAGFHRLMNICRSESVPATFFACALAFERNPLAAKEVVRSGHDIVCHGYRWEDVTKLSEAEEREHIRLAVESLERTTGSRPTGWYCRYGPSARTRRLLVEEGGFRFDCDAYNDDLPYWTTVADRRHLVVPYSLNNNDARFARNEFGSPKDFEEHLKYTFDRLYIEGATTPKMMSVGLHLRIAGQPARALALRNFIRYVKSFPDVWFARRSEIADYWYKEQQ